MKAIQRVGSLLLAGVILVASPATLWAESDAITGSFLPIDKNATGTKLFGPLSVYYEFVALAPSGGTTPRGCIQFEVDMSFTMKLKKGATSYAFASPAPTRLCYERHDEVAIIQAFFASTVIPAIFGCSQQPSPSLPPCPPFALKAVTDLTQDGSPQVAPPFFAVMDIDLAVKE